MFTSRQAAVVDALLKGKANKIIADELNMCENTVKVHVRRIMMKLKARNRTEVAYIVNGYPALRGGRAHSSCPESDD
jgi:DNA-binding NarL/FixJ family response regulator